MSAKWKAKLTRMHEQAFETFSYLRRNFVPSVGDQQYLTSKSEVEIFGEAVKFGISPEGLPSLFIPTANPQLLTSSLNFKGLHLDVVPSQGNDSSKALIRLQCLDENYFHQFSVLVDDVIASISSNDSSEVDQTVIDAVEKWHSLFSDASNLKLTKSAQIGLFCELELLLSLTELHSPAALQYWTGFDLARHDFVGKKSAIEVKGTTQRDTFCISIHGLTQLVPPANKSLHLLAFQLEAVPVGRNLLDQVNALIAKGHSRDALSARVSLLGLDIDSDETQSLFNFDIIQTAHSIVDDSFPQLTPSALKNPQTASLLSSVQYSINVGSHVKSYTDSLAEITRELF